MFEDLMMMNALMQAFKESEKDNFASPFEACNALKSFVEQDKQVLEKGDYIERNEFGRAHYKYPGQNQAAMVVEKLEGDKCGANGEDLLICVAVAKERFIFTKVDSRYYKKSNTEAGSNVFTFRKKE